MESTSLLDNRASINLLVQEFYAKVRLHALLGPVFNHVIHDWPAHIEHLTSFWESSLLRASSYRGNPIEKHAAVDNAVNNTITMEHFGIWLQLWFETIDTHFHGEIAQLAKARARNMSTIMFIKIYEARKGVSNDRTTS